jgi:isopenicillin N synthase-like dioxygenase
MLYYPASSFASTTEKEKEVGKEEGVDVRAGAHSDYGSLTLLFRLPGQGGLELQNPIDPTQWIPVPVNPVPDTLADPPILVNIGDLLSFWTGGMLKSTVHRVAFSHTPGGDADADAEVTGKERYSMAYFCHPLDGVELGAVPGEVIRKFVQSGDGEAELERQRVRLGLGEKREGKEEVLTAKQHLDRRLRVTYGLKG